MKAKEKTYRLTMGLPEMTEDEWMELYRGMYINIFMKPKWNGEKVSDSEMTKDSIELMRKIKKTFKFKTI